MITPGSPPDYSCLYPLPLFLERDWFIGSFYRDLETNFARYHSLASARVSRPRRRIVPGCLSARDGEGRLFNWATAVCYRENDCIRPTCDGVYVYEYYTYTYARRVSSCPNRQQRWLHRQQMVSLLTYTYCLPSPLPLYFFSSSHYISHTNSIFLLFQTTHPSAYLPTYLPTYRPPFRQEIRRRLQYTFLKFESPKGGANRSGEVGI